MVGSQITPRAHGAAKRLWRALAYNLHTFVLRRPELVADLPWLGVSLRAGSEDMLGRRLFKTGIYEPDVTDFVLRYLALAPQQLIFDVGANVGYYSVLAHRACGDGVPIHAIEAEQENHRLLLLNLERAGARSVVPEHCAVSDAPGELELYLWKSSNRGKHSLVPFEGAETVVVAARTLAQLYEGAGPEDREISLLKIDIEGAEHQAFVGAGASLERCRVILSELSPKFLARAGIDLDEHVGLVCDRGFELFEIQKDGGVARCTADDLRASTRACNVVYARRDQLGEPWARQLLPR